MGFADTTVIWRISFFITLLGFLVTLAGITSTYMAASELIPNMRLHLGFWDICDDTQSFSCRTVVEFLTAIEKDLDWVYGARAMGVLGLIFQGLAVVLSLYLTYISSGQLSCFIIGSVDALATIFGTIGGAVFISFGIDLLETTALMDAYPSWSFALYMTGQFCALVSCVLSYYESCRDRAG